MELNPPCVICGRIVPIINWHHTVPRSRGGEDSLQIPLCPDHHSQLHANALAIVARIRGKSKRPLRGFWNSDFEETNAKPYLEILVQALLLPIQGKREHLVSTSVPTNLFEGLKLLQADLGFSSQDKVIEYCLVNTLQSKGLLDVVTPEDQKRDNASLWFMHVPGSRKNI